MRNKGQKHPSADEMDLRIQETLKRHGFVQGCRHPGCHRSNASDKRFSNGLCFEHRQVYEAEVENELDELVEAQETQTQLLGEWS